MMTITPSAAEQIKASASQQDVGDMPLRIAARRADDESIEYAMGFADELSADDVRFTTEGIEVVLAPGSALLLKDAVMDYVEIEPGQHSFIFINPNDPHHKKED
ncbi:MAG TPA: iron-sulfur cluster assembly accessory protein [Gammaproteobacteria bacterium]|nr:iron-sulfur cluster assembly accessory protein [Gammaproteobacteria bacterium]